MDFKDLMEFRDVDFDGLIEPDINALRIFISRCKTSEISEDLVIGKNIISDVYSVDTDMYLPILQIDFESYIAYSVTNDSYTSWDDYEVFEGKAFRIYSKSRYLDFINTHTFADKDYLGLFVHYGIICLNHIINIVSVDKPVVKEINRE